MILFKSANRRVNYYKVNIFPTLFGDYLIQREYGAMHFSKPTNVIKQYAASNREALLMMLDIAVEKKSLGYLKAA